jgi:hypothetical protein
VIIQRGSLCQVGLRAADGSETLNVTAAVCKAFDLPHVGMCIKGSEAEIRKHLDGLAVASPRPTQQHTAQVDKDVFEALRALGYSAGESKEAVQAIPADAPADFESRFKLALGDGMAVTL